MKKSITISERGNKVIYRVGRRIVCYREGYRVYRGKPSDATHATIDALSENIAHEMCVYICERRIYAEMMYQNPVAYNAHKVLNALA